MRRKRKSTVTSTEPYSKDQFSEFDVLRFYNYYRTNYSEKDAKQFLSDYTTSQKKKEIINSQSYIPLSYCWMARMISNGNKLPEHLVLKLNNFVDNLKLEKRKVVKLDTLPTPSIEKKNEIRTNDAYSFLESLIEKLYDSKGKSEVNAEPVLLMYNLNKSQATTIADQLEKDHIQDYRTLSDDEDLQEGYSFLTKRQQNLIYKNLKKLKEEFLSVKNVVTSDKKRKRAIKLKPVSELIAKLKFKNNIYNVESIDLVHLIGKRVVYVASDVKRTLIRLESKSGFEVRSSFITNIDSAEKLIVYGTHLENAVRYLSKAKNEKIAKDIKKHVQIRRVEPVEIKNNEYRTTDKFCAIQGYLDL